MSGRKSDFQPAFERITATVSTLLKNAYVGLNAFERHVSDILDKQSVNQLLNQYDKFIDAGLTPQEARDMVLNLATRRLETAIRQRNNPDDNI